MLWCRRVDDADGTDDASGYAILSRVLFGDLHVIEL